MLKRQKISHTWSQVELVHSTMVHFIYKAFNKSITGSDKRGNVSMTYWPRQNPEGIIQGHYDNHGINTGYEG